MLARKQMFMSRRGCLQEDPEGGVGRTVVVLNQFTFNEKCAPIYLCLSLTCPRLKTVWLGDW